MTTQQDLVDRNIDGTSNREEGQTDGSEIEYPPGSVIFANGSSGYWPDWVEEDPDWERLYTYVRSETIISPRMAAILYNELIILIDEFRFSYNRRIDCLPFLARSYFRTSSIFATSFVACLERLLLRLRKGILPHPNCMGEYVALAVMLQQAAVRGDFEDLNDYLDGKLFQLPATMRDDDYEGLWLSFFPSLEDRMVMIALFKDESVDKHATPLHSACAYNPLLYAEDKCSLLKGIGSMGSISPNIEQSSKLRNLHPLRWFLVFSEREIENHVH